jgi:solute:Na+ symporter, SSS family
MHLLGLHWLDALVVVLYVIVILSIGKMLSHGVKGQGDFFLGGRSLGKWFQFFLNFGTMTDPGQATTTSSSVYRQGAGGAWIALITLFLTPYYWFSTVWFRRVRLTTMADLFHDRFGGRFLATIYAITTLLMAIVSIAGGNVVALKTLQPLMAKEPAIYSVEEKARVDGYYEFVELRKERAAAVTLPVQKENRYATLKGYYDRGELQPYITYLHPVTFYLVSTALVAVFVMLGGLKASAMVDAIQALLVIVISFILLPFGLIKVGGFAALHEKVPAAMFNLFGGDAASEYTWYSIAALLFVQFVGIVGSQANMTVAGSAKNEMAARLGAVTGGFSKRFVTISWAYCGLIAVALFGLNLSDPDQVWGLLTRELLPIGMIGVMIIGILGGKLALLGAQSVVLSGLVVKNLYEPLRPGKSEGHYMVVARATVPIVLAAGVAVGLYLNSVVALLKFAIVLLVIWGVPVTFIFLWRRVTQIAVLVQVLATVAFVALIPWVVSATPSLAQSEKLTLMTRERIVTVQSTAAKEDVAAGRAAQIGETITKQRRVESVSVFFEEGVAPVDPSNPNSPRRGRGLFRSEIYLVHLLGFDVAGFTPAQLSATRYFVDGMFPIVLIVVASLLTRRTDPVRVERFYARLKTPVAETLELDAQEVEKSYANPGRFDHHKLFPKTDWEFTKWDRHDALGFLACCGLVAIVLIVFKTVLVLGSA